MTLLPYPASTSGPGEGHSKGTHVGYLVGLTPRAVRAGIGRRGRLTRLRIGPTRTAICRPDPPGTRGRVVTMVVDRGPSDDGDPRGSAAGGGQDAGRGEGSGLVLLEVVVVGVVPRVPERSLSRAVTCGFMLVWSVWRV